MRGPRQAAPVARPARRWPARCWYRDQRAVASMEFALLLPVLLVLMFGAAETLRVVRAKMLLTSAVAAAAEIIAVQSGAVTAPGCETGTYSCVAGNLQDICQAATRMLQPLETATPTKGSGFSLSIAAVTNTDTTNPQSNSGKVNVVPVVQWKVYQSYPNRGAAFPIVGAGMPATLATPLILYDNNVALIVQGSFAYTPAFSYDLSGILGTSSVGWHTLTSTSLVEPRTGAMPCLVASTQLSCPPTD